MISFKQFLIEIFDKPIGPGPEEFIGSKPDNPYRHYVHNSEVNGHQLSVKFINTHKGTKHYDMHYDVNDESDKQNSGVTDPSTQVRIGLRVRRIVSAFNKHFQPDSITGMAADRDSALRQKKHDFNVKLAQSLNPQKINSRGNVVTAHFNRQTAE